MTQTEARAEHVGGRYRLTTLIGRGGAGAVWRGEDLRLRRAVAVKQILLSEQRSTRTRARAVREAQAVARLRTPGVVQLYDLFEDGPYAYLVMELVDVPSLSRQVRRDGPLDPRAAATAGRSLATTLSDIHRAGVVHRDVKPSNVLSVDGAWRLTDFGIALLGDDDATLTASGSVLGTPAYMAPEQARGERPGPAADRYGLGATLYFAVEGRAPYADEGSWETTRAVREAPPRPGQQLGPLGPIVEALLCKDPDERPSHDQIAVALARAAGDGATVVRPPAVVEAPSEQPTVDQPPPRVAAAPVVHTEAPRGSREDRRQLRHLALRAAALLLLLVAALMLLFLVVREQPADAAGTGPIASPRTATYDGGVVGAGAPTWNR